MQINCKGKLIDLSHPKVMGILNMTPDSFYDGGRNNRMDNAFSQVERMVKEGAFFLGIGGASTRPGAEPVSEEGESRGEEGGGEMIMKNLREALCPRET